MKTVKIGICSSKEMQDYIMSIARGDVKVGEDSPTIFMSPEHYKKYLSRDCDDIVVSKTVDKYVQSAKKKIDLDAKQ